MKTIFLFLQLLCITILSWAQNSNTEFADILIESYYSGANENFNDFYGGTLKNFPVLTNPEKIIGNNTIFFLSLPKNSYVIVKFTDNQIIDYPDQDDIFITEIGCNGENAEIYISTNGTDFIKLGIVSDCGTSSLDLEAINYKEVVRYIKVVGIDNGGDSPGFDLVSIKGLPNSTINKYVDIDSIDTYFINLDSTAGKKIILKNLHFVFNSSELITGSQSSLDSLRSILLRHPHINIKIIGHTDNIGNDDFNLELSLNRAKTVTDYLINKGVDSGRIQYTGRGEKDPLRDNKTEAGRKINRRVEIEINQDQIYIE